MKTLTVDWALQALFWDDPSMALSTRVTGLTADSRQVQPGDAFLAYPGLSGHGLDYVEQAIARNAAVVIWQPNIAWDQPRVAALMARTTIPFRVYPTLRADLGRLADRFFGQPSQHMAVVGVTGTNGKTSCVHFMAHVLSQTAPCGLLGTLGNGLYGETEQAVMTTPDVVSVHHWMATMRQAQATAVVMEVSSHALDQGRVDSVQYNVAILTNLSRDHLDYHGDMAHYAAAKKKLFENAQLQAVIINRDDAMAAEFIAAVQPGVPVITFGFGTSEQAGQHICLHDIQLKTDGMQFQVSSPWGEAQISCALFGGFNVLNLGAALGALCALGVEFDVTIARLQTCTAVPGRLSYYHAVGKPHAFVDYAHTPDALAQSLRTLAEHFSGQRMICVFGCGGDRDQGKRALMGRMAEAHADAVIVTDDNPRSESGDAIVAHILQGVQHPENIQVERDRTQAICLAFEQAQPGDVILVAGKGHETYQIVGRETRPFSDADVVQGCLL